MDCCGTSLENTLILQWDDIGLNEPEEWKAKDRNIYMWGSNWWNVVSEGKADTKAS